MYDIRYIYLSVCCVLTVCLWQANGSLWDWMLHKKCPESWLQHRREVQSTSHLQSPKCSFQRQHTCGYVQCCMEATKCIIFFFPMLLQFIYSVCFLGRFIHAILHPVLSTAKSCLNVGMKSVAENSETRFVFQTCKNKYSNFFAIITLCNLSQWCTDSSVSEGTPAKAEETAESPQAKRRKPEERDLSFLQVKNKNDQDSLFVDLGKRNYTLLFVLFHPYIRHLLGLNDSLDIFCTPFKHHFV